MLRLTAWFKVLVSIPYSVAKSLSSITCCPLITFIRDSILSTTTNWSRFVTSSPFSVFSVMSVIFIFIFKITNCDLKRIVVILRTKVVLLAFKPLLHNPFLWKERKINSIITMIVLLVIASLVVRYLPDCLGGREKFTSANVREAAKLRNNRRFRAF